MPGVVDLFKRLFKFLGREGSRTAQEAASYAVGTASAEALAPLFLSLRYKVNEKYPNEKVNPNDYIESWKRGNISEAVMRSNLRQLGLDDFTVNILINNAVQFAGAGDYIESYVRGKISREELTKILGKLGFKAETVDLLLANREQLLNVGDIQALYNRGEITESEAKQRLAKMGYSSKDQEAIIKLAGYIPTVSDFIRMAVREVFTPAIAEQYGLFEDYPEELTKYAKMAGLNPEYAKYYWAAHWELPSYTQGVEMYHRGIISYDELKTLLRSLDVMPYWRDKLIQLSETPFTRVDVRRMYRLGVLDFEETIRAYMDLGYSREKATKLAEFTKLDVAEEERNFTKTEITTLYRNGSITRQEAGELLGSLGYSEDHRELILSLEDYRMANERLNAIKSTVKRRYLRGFIDKNDVVVILSKENIPAREIDALLRSWDIEKEEQAGLPTKAELTRFYKKGIITIDEYAAMLKRLGYSDEIVGWYVEDIKKGG
jgi:hypothetical protein